VPQNRQGEQRGEYQAHLLSLALGICDEAVHPIRRLPKRPKPIHRSRVAIKKLRALLLLLRPAIATKTLASLQSNLRKAAQQMSQFRDIDSLSASLSLLVCSGALSRTMLFTLQEALSAPAAESRPLKVLTLSNARRCLMRVRKSLKDLPDRPLGKSEVERVLRRTYRKARLLFCAYQSDQSVETFHAWRKLTKRLSYQLRLTTPIRNSPGQGFIRMAEKIGDLAGRERDLMLLAEALQAAPKSRPREHALRAIQKTLPKIHKKVIASGQAFFERSKKRFFQITGKGESQLTRVSRISATRKV
jgi:CHAD domain-containing protein